MNIKQIQSQLQKYSDGGWVDRYEGFPHDEDDDGDLEDEWNKEDDMEDRNSPIYYYDYYEEMGHGIEWNGWITDIDGSEIYEFGADVIESGYMKNEEDTDGLEVYLKQMKIIPDDAELRNKNKHYFGDSFR